MTLLKQALAILGTVVIIAVLVAIISPKTAHAVAAALVQIEPGTTTHMGQNESQMISLLCNYDFSTTGCLTVDSYGGIGAPYAVPSGYTLIVTDWEFANPEFGKTQAGSLNEDFLYAAGFPGNPFVYGYAIADVNGYYGTHIQFTSGIRFASGLTIADHLAQAGQGSASVHGYLVPN